jgi:hypothetical protein
MFYLVSTSGMSLNVHYCGGKIKHVSLYSSSEKGCCGKKKMSKKCCKDKVAYFKIKDNHKVNQLAKVVTPSSKLITAVLSLVINYSYVSSFYITIQNYHAPPVLYDNPLYLKHQVLLI